MAVAALNQPGDESAHGSGAASRPGPVSVVLADDQSLMRMGFRMVLDAEDDICVILLP